MSFKATAVVLSPSDIRITYSSGENPSRASALAELQAVLATISAKQLLSASVSETLTGTDLSSLVIGHDETVPFEEGSLVLRRAGVSPEPPFVTKTKTIENMALVYKVSTGPQIDTTATDIAALVTAFYDGTGRNGFAPVLGESKYAK